MTVFINSMLSSAVDNAALVLSLQVVCVIALVVFLVTKLLMAASEGESRFAKVLNQAVNAPLVALLMVFLIIALLRVVLIIQQ